MSSVPLFNIAVSGGEVDPLELWPEIEPLGQYGKKSDPREWAEKWTCANQQPHELWISQDVGEGAIGQGPSN